MAGGVYGAHGEHDELHELGQEKALERLGVMLDLNFEHAMAVVVDYVASYGVDAVAVAALTQLYQRFASVLDRAVTPLRHDLVRLQRQVEDIEARLRRANRIIEEKGL